MNTVVLEETCLDEYISEPIKISEADKKINLLQAKVNELNEFIKLRKKEEVVSCERPIIDKIQTQIYEYLATIREIEVSKDFHCIDPSFLSMSNKIGFFEKVPKFAVYRCIFKRDYSESISIGNCWISRWNWKSHYDSSYIKIQSNYGNNNNFLPGIFAKELIKAVGKNPQICSDFIGLIPQRIKQKLRDVREIFDDHLYFIVELKPEEWKKAPSPKEDPLIIGGIGSKCFLVDHFDCTPMEDYVRREFIS